MLGFATSAEVFSNDCKEKSNFEQILITPFLRQKRGVNMSNLCDLSKISDPKRKYDLVFIWEVCCGNPNGDPDADNAPRRFPNDTVFVSPECVKRGIRDYMEMVTKNEIYYRRGPKLKVTVKNTIGDIKAAVDIQHLMCEEFVDIRLFGAVFPATKKERDNTSCQGPMVLFPSIAQHKVSLDTEVSMTRVCKEDKENEGTFGRKHMIPYVLLKGTGTFSPKLAEKTLVSEEDLILFWTALIENFEHIVSPSRGFRCLRKLVVFAHDHVLGNCHRHLLYDRVSIKQIGDSQYPEKFEDFKVDVDIENLPKGVMAVVF